MITLLCATLLFTPRAAAGYTIIPLTPEETARIIEGSREINRKGTIEAFADGKAYRRKHPQAKDIKNLVDLPTGTTIGHISQPNQHGSILCTGYDKSGKTYVYKLDPF